MKEVKPGIDPDAGAVRPFELPADLAGVLEELERIAGGGGRALVDDPTVIRSLWGTRFPPGLDRLADAIDRLVALRYVRRVFIGNEPHLIPGGQPQRERRHDPAVEGAPSLQDEVFRLELAGDVEHEKMILYRVLLVIEVLAALILLRELFVV